MADTISELLVRINAEDNASAVLAKLSGNVGSLSSAGAAGAKSVQGLTGAMNAGKSVTEQYKSKMEEASKAVQTKKQALETAKTAYTNTTKAAKENTAQLKSQKTNIESLIRAKEREISALEHSNTVVNKGSQAYKDNKKAIQWTRMELESLESQNSGIVQSINKQQAAVESSSKAYQKAQGEVKNAQEVYSEYSSGLAKVEQAEKNAARAARTEQWETAGKNIKNFGEGIDSVTKPFQIVAAGAVVGGIAVSKMAMDYETAFTGVKKTIDGTPEQMNKVNTEIRQMSKEIPVSAKELANIAQIGGQLGVGANDITKFTETIAAMGVATNLSGEEGTAAMARLLNVTGESVDNVDRVGSAIVALGNNTATSEAEIASMAVRMGKYGNTVGMNTAQVLGYSAALSSMGIEAQMGGSAIGRTWLDIQKAVSSGGDALNAYAKYAGKSAEEFKQQWSTDPSGAFNGLIKGLSASEDLTLAMAELGIENTQDQQAVMALANNYDLLTKCMDLSGTAYKENTALMKEANTAYGTTANQIQLAKNAVADAAINWGNVLLPEIKSGAEWVSGLADKFGSLDDNQKRAVISGAKTAVVIGATGKAVVAGVKGVGNFVEGIANIKKGFDKVKVVASTGGLLSSAVPTLSKIAAVAGPAALGIVAVSTATVGMYKAAKAYENYRADWSRGGYELSESIKNHADVARELNDLQWEFKDLTGKIELGELQGDELNAAKKRLEEIKSILSEKYQLNINVDSSELDAAIEKTKQIEYLEAKQENPKLSKYVEEGANDYYNTRRDRANAEVTLKNVEEQKQATENFRGELLLLNNAYEKGEISQADFTKGFNQLVEATGNPKFKDMPIEALLNGNALNNYADNLQNKIKTISDNIETYGKNMAEFEASATQLADSGILELEFGDTEEGLRHIESAVKAAGLSANDYAVQAAQIQTGQKDLNQLFNEGGQTLDKFVSTYISDMQQFGASTQETVTGAALLKNGFTDVSQACVKGGDAVKNVLNDIKSLGQQNGLFEGMDNNGIADEMNKIAHSMKLIPDNKNISINADGDISLVDKAEEKTKSLQNIGSVSFQVNADGNVDVLDQAGNKVDELKKDSTVQITVDANADDEELEAVQEKVNALQEQGINVDIQYTNENEPPEPENKTVDGTINYKVGEVEKPEEITADGKVNYQAGETPETVPDAQGKANYELGTHPTKAPGINGTAKYNGKFPTKAPTIYGTAVYTAKVNPQAKGTQNFPGGLAMVNDQKGVADPRELIIDRGQAFIPRDKDVILPLSKGAKVYTAAQTKRIMRNMGIPRYAEGKDNSDAFKTAQEDWTHYTRTHAVTVTDELEKWTELSAQFTGNIKDAEDCAEQLYSATRDVRNELNELSEEYIKERSFLNDWDSWGDSAVDAFNRVREREAEYVASAKITQREADKYLKGLGEDLYDFRVENSEKWLDKQIKYSNMSVDDQMAAIDRMEAYTADYYSRGIISYSKYIEGMESIDALRVEKLSDAYSKAENRAERYKQLGFAKGDNLINTLGRQLKNLEDAFQAGAFKGDEESYWDKRASLISEQNSAIYDEFQTAMDKQQTLYDTWDMWDAVGGKTGWLEAYARQLQDLRDREIISEDEFKNKMLNIYVEHYNAQSEALDEALQAQSDYIDSVNDRYDQLINKKEDAFDWMQLERDIDEERTTKNIYAGSVTQRGKDVYKDSVERLEELEHEKEIKLLQEEQTRAVSALKADYELMVQYEKPLLNSLNASCIDVKGIANDLKNNAAGNQALLQQLIDLVKNLNVGNTATYGDTNYNISGVDSGLLSAFMRRGAASISGF